MVFSLPRAGRAEGEEPSSVDHDVYSICYIKVFISLLCVSITIIGTIISIIIGIIIIGIIISIINIIIISSSSSNNIATIVLGRRGLRVRHAGLGREERQGAEGGAVDGFLDI